MPRFSREPARIIEVAGELTPRTVSAFTERVSQAVAAGVDVIVDLSALEAIDSMLLRAIIAADKSARAMRHKLVLSGVQAEVARVLQTTGLDRKLQITDSQPAR